MEIHDNPEKYIWLNPYYSLLMTPLYSTCSSSSMLYKWENRYFYVAVLTTPTKIKTILLI